MHDHPKADFFFSSFFLFSFFCLRCNKMIHSAAYSHVVENTAFFGDVALRFPRIVHHYYDRNSDWGGLLRWGLDFCNLTGVFTGGAHQHVLTLVSPDRVDPTSVAPGGCEVVAVSNEFEIFFFLPPSSPLIGLCILFFFPSKIEFLPPSVATFPKPKMSR